MISALKLDTYQSYSIDDLRIACAQAGFKSSDERGYMLANFVYGFEEQEMRNQIPINGGRLRVNLDPAEEHDGEQHSSIYDTLGWVIFSIMPDEEWVQDASADPDRKGDSILYAVTVRGGKNQKETKTITVPNSVRFITITSS